MTLPLDILSYVVFVGCEFAVLCVITRVGRGWPLQLVGLIVLGGFAALMERVFQLSSFSFDIWLAVMFAGAWIVFAALVFGLARFGLGQRLFLSLLYGAYSSFSSSVFHLLAYRDCDGAGHNVLGLSSVGAVLVGLLVVVLANLAFIFWILPQVPHDRRDINWSVPCCCAGVMFLHVFGSGIWPVPIISAPASYGVLFALASVAAWVGFPLLCRAMHEQLRNADVLHSLELMTTEVKIRRAAIDEARRIRHDRRHDRAQLAEYLLSERREKALAYLRELDEEAQETPTDKLVWCENETVNAILSGCSRKASAHGVGFSAEIHVERDIPLPDVKLVAVLANLIENAIEAAGAGRGITVTIRQREHGIGITVANPVPEGFALSPKGLPCEDPGIGMESIRRVVERYHGEWLYELKDGLLICRVVLIV